MTDSTATTYTVEGMTCSHCREGSRFEDTAIEIAVREAGYRVTDKS